MLSKAIVKEATAIIAAENAKRKKEDGAYYDEVNLSYGLEGLCNDIDLVEPSALGNCCGIVEIGGFGEIKAFDSIAKARFVVALSELSTGAVVATTTPNQKGGIDLLTYAEFEPIFSCIGNTGTRITFWQLTLRNTKPRAR